jgi:uncharacterized protein
MRFEIVKSDSNNQFYFRIKATNGKVLAHSEHYYNRDDCEHAIKLIQANAFYAVIDYPA